MVYRSATLVRNSPIRVQDAACIVIVTSRYWTEGEFFFLEKVITLVFDEEP